MLYYHHIHHFVRHTNTSSGFWGAFFGAFLAFFFGFLTYVITKRRERFVQHKNALIKLERILNKHLDDLSVFQEIASDGERIISQQKVTSNRLFKLKIPENIDMEIGSIELVNKFFVYNTSIDRLNFNVDTINHSLTRLEDLFIGGQQPHPSNFTFIEKTLHSLVEDIPRLSERTIKFLIIIRIHLNKIKYRNSFIYGVFNTHWEQEICEEDLNYERKELMREIEQVQKEVREDVF